MLISNTVDEDGKFVKVVAIFRNSNQDMFHLSKFNELVESFESSEEFALKNKQILKAKDEPSENNTKNLTKWQMNPKMTRKNIEKHLKHFYITK